MHQFRVGHIVAFLISLTVILVACSPKVRHGLLNTVFDGVPPYQDKNDFVVIGDTIAAIDSTSMSISPPTSSFKNVYHPPFKEKNCSSCHDTQHMGQMVAEEPQLCYQCHDSKTGNHDFKHGPVGAGYCTSCHRPHMAEAKKLLLNDGEELCLNCHSSERIAANRIHQKAKQKQDCLSCHNPHSSDNRFMMQRGACYNCHDDKSEDYTFIHGPVSSKYCSMCHGSHASKNDKLLVRSGKDLCLNCHNPSAIAKNNEHKKTNKDDCLQCHNPHGGEDKFMLN